jgi:hypothetical protein
MMDVRISRIWSSKSVKIREIREIRTSITHISFLSCTEVDFKKKFATSISFSINLFDKSKMLQIV